MAKRASIGRIRTLVEQITTETLVKFNIVPATDAAQDLGTSAKRFKNLYIGDLHMQNDRGHYQLIEEEEYLSIRNHKTGKLYKFVLEEIEESSSEEGE
jgi:hypothetical protein